jgi:hypothetical protein
MVIWLCLAALAAVVIGIVMRRQATPDVFVAPAQRSNVERIKATETVALTVPELGTLGEDIATLLRSGKDPNEALSIPHRAHHLSVVGESFTNANGTSRQEIIARSEPGTNVYLVPEPDNPHDAKAVRVFVSEGGAATAQIGYLPREAASEMADELRRGRVACWLASTGHNGNLWGAVLFVVRTEAAG